MTLEGTFKANCDMPGCKTTLSVNAETKTEARKYFKNKGWEIRDRRATGDQFLMCPPCKEHMYIRG